MILKAIERIRAVLTSEPKYVDEVQTTPESDGRKFVWVRAKGGTLSPVHAQVIFDEQIGKPAEVVRERVLDPEEYGDDLNQLIARYPAPTVIMDYSKKD